MSNRLQNKEELAPGDALDFWRVLAVEPPYLLLAEMKLPGKAVLEFTLAQAPEGGTELRQVARFLPRGLGSLLYWYALIPSITGVTGACSGPSPGRWKNPSVLDRSKYQAGSSRMAGNGDGNAGEDFWGLDFPKGSFPFSFLNPIPD